MKELISRPQLLDDFVGKAKIKLSLRTYIESVKRRECRLDHIIFYGSPGVGKTSLATIIANELNSKIHYIQGPSINKISDVLDLVSMIQEGDVVFIDEIHQVNIKCLEMFYSILEDFVADVRIGKEFNSQFTRLDIAKFTMICSTTNYGRLPAPFIDRFGIKFFVDLYTVDEISEIIGRINEKNNFNLTKEQMHRIAKNSKGTPRIAINLLNRFYDYKLINPNMTDNQIFQSIGVFELGLNDADISYMKILNNSGKPIGIRSIAQQLFLDLPTIENTIEPYLLRIGLIFKNTYGRILSFEGKEYLKKLKLSQANT